MKWLMRLVLLIIGLLVLIALSMFLGVVFDVEFFIEMAEAGLHLFFLLAVIALILSLITFGVLFTRFFNMVKKR